MPAMSDEPEFFGKFLRSLGYQEYKCRVCGEKFWSLIPRDRCPDRPCSKYDFLFKDYPKVRNLSLNEARQKFIDFFRRNGHGYVDPYPVLARWRNDLYLTIASIIVFQPAVTEGIVDPPYNPLVIVQPCIRLEDIDEVGLTFGRHLSSFEMGGHHAFNKENNYIYWVDETLEYAYNFFTKDIGIPEEDIVFKPSWWEGGGNAGPAYEVVVDGLELATLVFMKYRVENSNYSLMNIRVIDTGYGIERIAWFTQRSPTAFHTIFGDLLNRYKDILGIDEPDYHTLKSIVHKLSDMDIGSLDQLRKYLGRYGYLDYYKELRQAILLYTLLDHYRTLALMLSDGIVPSNTGEGYLARLVLRRSLRALYQLGIAPSEYEELAIKLMEEMIDYWRDQYVYSNFIKHRDYILDVLSNEIRKYVETLDRGVRIVDKIIKKKRSLGIDDLVRIYDSHGIPPEMIANRAKEYGVEISIPHDFYSLVAKKHGQPKMLQKYREHFLPSEIVDWVSGFPETRKLFHLDPYLRRFKAKVIGIKNNYVILDQSAFYPLAGGQDHDTGHLVLPDNTRVKVKKVYKYGEVIIHELEKDVDKILSKGDIVEGIINWIRRYRLMRHHTATHIILGAARRILGDHVWQAGAEKTIEKGRLDITHYRMLTGEEIKKIEELANKIVDERIDLRFNYLGKFEAEKKYGTKIYQGGAIISKTLRIVEIPGWDAEACYGTHLHNTGEVGGIKIINVEKIQDGVIRFEYIAGTRIPEYSYNLENIIEKIASMIKTSPKQILPGIEKFYDEYIEIKEILSRYREKLMKLYEDRLAQELIEVCGYKIIYLYNDIGDHRFYRDLALNISRRGAIIFYDTGKYIEVFYDPARLTRPIDLRTVLNELIKKYPNIRGGGKQDHITFRSNISSKELFNSFRRILSEMNSCEEN